jgi:hypothetical protein
MPDISKCKTLWITSDFISTTVKEQDSNLRWLRDLLKRPLEQTGRKVRVASNRFDPEWKFDRDQYLFLAGVESKSDDTHIDLNSTEVTKEMRAMVRDALDEKPFIIGYEMSPATLKLLDSLEIPYVDIWLGPVRFLTDITFALRSNVSSINDKLTELQIDDEVIFSQASVLKIQSYRGFSKSHSIHRDNTAVFAGQVLVDKALLHNGRMLSILDFKDQFSDICRDHTEVLYARHPFVRSGDEDFLKFARSFRNVRIAEKSGYHLLTDEAITTVCSITSSFVTEAHYFGKEARYFAPPVMSILSKDRPYMIMSHRIFFGNFWQALLTGTDMKNLSDFALGRDRLRDALAFYWSYREIDKLETLRNSFYTFRNSLK